MTSLNVFLIKIHRRLYPQIKCPKLKIVKFRRNAQYLAFFEGKTDGGEPTISIDVNYANLFNKNKRANEFIKRLLVHELTHYYAETYYLYVPLHHGSHYLNILEDVAAKLDLNPADLYNFRSHCFARWGWRDRKIWPKKNHISFREF